MAELKNSGRFRFLAAEFVVIVVGVLVALAVDQFIAERQERISERNYAERLRIDLASDTSELSWFRGVLDAKARVLTDLLTDSPLADWADDPTATMADLTYSTFYGLPPINSSTFRELETTGGLQLIQDADLRSRLTDHYLRYQRMVVILDERVGPFRELTLAALPGVLQYETRADFAAADPSLLSAGIQAILESPGLEEAVNAELGYTAMMRFYLDEADTRTRALLDRLDAAYPD